MAAKPKHPILAPPSPTMARLAESESRGNVSGASDMSSMHWIALFAADGKDIKMKSLPSRREDNLCRQDRWRFFESQAAYAEVTGE